MGKIEKNERAAKLRALAGEIRGNLHNNGAVADGFELIADTLEQIEPAQAAKPRAPAKKTTSKKGA